MVNSRWTRNHIDTIWQMPTRTDVVYPPVNTAVFQEIPLARDTAAPPLIISIAQFRPEKDHAKQIAAFARLLELLPSFTGRLVLIGGCRDAADRGRVEQLEQQARALGVGERVEFVINAPFETLLQYFGRALVGLHTMWCEHFGIGVVELQASGVITIAHNSGGPQSDIIDHGRTGYLADTVEEYAQSMHSVFTTLIPNQASYRQLQQAARTAAARFSDQVFFDAFSQSLSRGISSH
jgi:alpha-1,2-mannosyltransferase